MPDRDNDRDRDDHRHSDHHSRDEVPSWAHVMDMKLDLIIAKLEHSMAKIDDVVASIAQQTTLIDGVSTLITGLRQTILDAGGDPTKINKAFEDLAANTAKLTAALQENVPTPSDPPVDPEVSERNRGGRR